MNSMSRGPLIGCALIVVIVIFIAVYSVRTTSPASPQITTTTIRITATPPSTPKLATIQGLICIKQHIDWTTKCEGYLEGFLVYLLDPTTASQDPGYTTPRMKIIEYTSTNPHGGYSFSVLAGTYVLVVDLVAVGGSMCYYSSNSVSGLTMRYATQIVRPDGPSQTGYMELIGTTITVSPGQTVVINIAPC